MAAEKNFENRIKKFLEEEGIWHVKFFGCAFTRSGIPDLLCCVNGRFLAIEVKAEKGKVAPLQVYEKEQIEKSGGIAVIVKPSQFDELKSLIKNLKV